MASKTSTNLNTLSINQIPTRALYRQLKEDNQLNEEQSLVIIDDDFEQRLYKDEVNVMSANGKIQMANEYVPISGNDIATKKYVDNSNPTITPTVGFTSNNQIYIGTTVPSSSSALIWVDISSNGVLKYRTSSSDSWKPIPVAWG